MWFVKFLSLAYYARQKHLKDFPLQDYAKRVIRNNLQGMETLATYHVFSLVFTDLPTVGSSVMAPLDHTNFATLWIVQPILLITEQNSVLNLTAGSSEDGTTPGDRTLEWMVRLLLFPIFV